MWLKRFFNPNGKPIFIIKLYKADITWYNRWFLWISIIYIQCLALITKRYLDKKINIKHTNTIWIIIKINKLYFYLNKNILDFFPYQFRFLYLIIYYIFKILNWNIIWTYYNPVLNYSYIYLTFYRHLFFMCTYPEPNIFSPVNKQKNF